MHRYDLECSKGRNKLALLTPIQLNHKCKLHKHVYACSVGKGLPAQATPHTKLELTYLHRNCVQAKIILP